MTADFAKWGNLDTGTHTRRTPGEEEGREQAGEKLGHRWEEKNNAVGKEAEKGGRKWSLTVPTPRHSPLTGHTSSHTMSCT